MENNNYHKRIISIYSTAKKRCNNPKSISYKYYWWRWIKFNFNGIKEFRDMMLPSYIEHIKIYWEKDTTLDRIDSNWNYCKENCRWATREEQQQNKRNPMKLITYKWETHIQAEWIRILWIRL